MRILSIETSCDETAVSVLECSGDEHGATFALLGNGLHSQVDAHREFGGVYPSVAKREHARNLVPMLRKALGEAGMDTSGTTAVPADFDTLMAREHELGGELSRFFSEIAVPDIDAVAVTYGPGLEPSLWVGVNFAKALASAWQKPFLPVNHMEGHMLVALLDTSNEKQMTFTKTELPALGLLISGGHTELVLMQEWLSYRIIGETRDDAVGEAFDKVARMLSLPYPGGPEISKLAEAARKDGTPYEWKLPKPMLTSDSCDFSFSGLKTAVLYLLKDRTLSNDERAKLAEAFEDTVAEVLWVKTEKALEQTGAKTLIIGGGVSANTHIARVFEERLAERFPEVALHISPKKLSGDNAVMIGVAAYFRALKKDYADPADVIAKGTLALAA